VAHVRLLWLRAIDSAPDSALLPRLLLIAALFLAVRHLLLRWRKDLSPEQRAARHFGPWLPAGLLAGWALLSLISYQGPVTRGHQLEIAQSAPVRVSYGDAARAPVIQVFTAPGCGPCKSLEERLRSVIAQGYAVQYIPSSLGDNDWDQINAAMCQADRKAGFERLFGGGGPTQPIAAPGCQSGVRDNEAVLRKLAGKLYFPTVVMPDGLMLIGAPSDEKLQAYLRAAAPLPAAAGGGQPL